MRHPQLAPQRCTLSVPASERRKVAKAWALDVDEVVVDLEDAVAPAAKESARSEIAALRRRPIGTVAVRVNAVGTPWHEADIAACVANEAVDSIVLPKGEEPAAVADLAARTVRLGPQRRAPIGVQVLVESPLGLHRAADLANASKHVTALILGYADLAASMGRSIDASWQFAQDTLVLAARLAGVRAIDGPLLSIQADERLRVAVRDTRRLGFDGKWVIHPDQASLVQGEMTPGEQEVAEAIEVLEVLRSAAAAGSGAVQWRGRMLDEALAAQARRVLSRAGRGGKQ